MDVGRWRVGGSTRSSRFVALVSIAIVCALGLLVDGANASLNFSLQPYPDIYSAYIKIHYSASTYQYTADGWAIQLIDGNGLSHDISPSGPFTLRATIDNSGDLQPGGTLTIGGQVAELGFASGTLLTANLTAFGFTDAYSPLEFLFQVTGGDASRLFGSGGGLLLHPSYFPGNFLNDFSNKNANSDSGVIPEPASLGIWSLLAAVALFAGARQCRRRYTTRGKATVSAFRSSLL